MKILPALKLLRIILLMSLVAMGQPVMAGSTGQNFEEAEQLHQQAVHLYQEGKYQESLPLLQRALSICERALGPEHASTAASLNDLGMLYLTLGQYDKALPLFQRALSIYEKTLHLENERTATTLNNIGSLYDKLGQYDKALPFYQRALVITEKVLGPTHEYTATSLNNLGNLYQTLGQYDKAQLLYQRALAITERSSGREYANSLNNLGTLQETLGQYDKALPLIQRALGIYEKVLGSEHQDTATCLNNLSSLYELLGQYDKALPLYQHALAINEKALGPENARTADSLNNLGLFYSNIGQYDKALPLLHRALATREKILGLDHAHTADSLNNLALLYEDLGQYDRALPLQQRASAITEKIFGSEHERAAIALNNLGFLYDSLGQYDKALLLYRRALAIIEKVLGPEHESAALSLNNLGHLYGNLGQYDNALPLFQRALTIHEKIFGFVHQRTATSLNNLALLYDSFGQDDKGLPLHQRAYRSALIAHVPETLKSVQASLGTYYSERGDPAVAIFYLKGAVNTMQSIRAQSRSLDRGLQQSLLQKNEFVYNRLIDLLVEEGRLAEAQQVISMLKEDEYFDFIRRDGQADNRTTRMDYNDSERPLAHSLEQMGNDGAALFEQRRSLDKQAKLGLISEQEQHRKKIQARLVLQEKQIVTLLNDIPNKLRTVNAGQRVVNSDEHLAQLRTTLKSLGNGAVLLSYVVTDNHVRILLTTPDTLLARKAEISAKDLNRKITQFRRVLQNQKLDAVPLAQEMYSLLISPVADDLKKANAKTLMLSLDGSLRYLPMAVLHDGSAYLVERYPLSMFTEVAKDRLNATLNAHWKVAGLGLTQSVGEFSALPSVKQELTGIVKGQWWKGTEGILPGDIYLDQDFTRSRLHGVLDQDYSVVHISSHFKFIPGNESQSFLVLGNGQQLSLADIRTGGWQFNAVDLLTLSACETGLGGGKDGNGREIEGFGVLAQRQGAKGVLATLWSVADQSTAKFMREFYRYRQDGHLTKAEALRRSQLAFINGESNKSASSIVPARPYAHPYYWAPFILMGNWL